MRLDHSFTKDLGERPAAGRVMLVCMMTIALSLAAAMLAVSPDPAEARACAAVRIVDGDTFYCNGVKVRLQGIDAPEKGRCRRGRVCAPGDPLASEDNLRRLTEGRAVVCRGSRLDYYRRPLVRCSAGRTDLSCAQLAGGFAIRRYAAIRCW